MSPAPEILVVSARNPGELRALTAQGVTLVYVGRAASCPRGLGLHVHAELGNPFRTPPLAREEAILRYGAWLSEQQAPGGPVHRALTALHARRQAGERLALVCWCAPLPCHAEVIRQALDRWANLQIDSSTP